MRFWKRKPEEHRLAENLRQARTNRIREEGRAVLRSKLAKEQERIMKARSVKRGNARGFLSGLGGFMQGAGKAYSKTAKYLEKTPASSNMNFGDFGMMPPSKKRKKSKKSKTDNDFSLNFGY